MIVYPPKITKEEVRNLPKEEFKGDISMVNTQEELKEAMDYLNEFPVVGFDTETRPSFRKGQMHFVSLMQLSTDDRCYLIRLHKTGIPKELMDFLKTEKVLKIGLSLRDDFMALCRKKKTVVPSNFIDLQKIVKDYAIEEASLQKIYAILFDKKISKSQRLTNWEAPELTLSQQKYAALDAWACLRIYDELLKNKN